MTGLPPPEALRAAMLASWPAAEEIRLGPFHLRRSPGGGQRVTAATVEPGADGLAETLPRAEAQMQAWGQSRIFQITPETPGLDALLEVEGYRIKDPVLLYVADLDTLAAIDTPRLSTFAHWPPLSIQRDIWAEGGIERDRVAVMDRVVCPKTSILARRDDRPVGTAFVALDHRIAVIHALEVQPDQRRKGDGRRMLSRAAQWARGLGGTHLALAVTEANIGARQLYAQIGMQPVTRYHYRVKE